MQGGRLGSRAAMQSCSARHGGSMWRLYGHHHTRRRVSQQGSVRASCCSNAACAGCSMHVYSPDCKQCAALLLSHRRRQHSTVSEPQCGVHGGALASASSTRLQLPPRNTLRGRRLPPYLSPTYLGQAAHLPWCFFTLWDTHDRACASSVLQTKATHVERLQNHAATKYRALSRPPGSTKRAGKCGLYVLRCMGQEACPPGSVATRG